MELQRRGVQVFVSTHDYMFASYFEVKKTAQDDILFHSLSTTNTSDVISYENAEKFADLKSNPIISAFDRLLNEIYNIGL